MAQHASTSPWPRAQAVTATISLSPAAQGLTHSPCTSLSRYVHRVPQVHWYMASDALPKLPTWAASGKTWAPEVTPVPGGDCASESHALFSAVAGNARLAPVRASRTLPLADAVCRHAPSRLTAVVAVWSVPTKPIAVQGTLSTSPPRRWATAVSASALRSAPSRVGLTSTHVWFCLRQQKTPRSLEVVTYSTSPCAASTLVRETRD